MERDIIEKFLLAKEKEKRHADNVAGLTGLWNGIYYLHGKKPRKYDRSFKTRHRAIAGNTGKRGK